MDISSILQTQSAADQASATIGTSKGAASLGVDDFLKLLTVQLSSQDPMKPMEDTQFISQMANFTSLEQMKVLSSDFASFSKQQSMIAAQSFLGKTVTALGSDDGTVTGVVSGVKLEDGEPMLTINGAAYPLSSVTDVALTAVTPAPTTPAITTTTTN